MHMAMRALAAAVGTRGDVSPVLALLFNGFVLESNVLAVKPDIAWNLQRDSASLTLRTAGLGNWNVDQGENTCLKPTRQ